MQPVLLISTMSNCGGCTKFVSEELDDLVRDLESTARIVRIHNDGSNNVPLAIRERAPITPGFLLFEGEEYAKYYDEDNMPVAPIISPVCFSYAVIHADPVTQKRVNMRFIPFKRARSADMIAAWVRRCIANFPDSNDSDDSDDSGKIQESAESKEIQDALDAIDSLNLVE